MIDYLTLQALALHDPTRGTVWRGNSGIVHLECARCAYRYIENEDACPDADTRMRILSTTTLMAAGRPDGYYECRACLCRLTV